MKFLLVGFIALLAACAQAQTKYPYVLPPASCRWGASVDVLAHNKHTKTTHYVFGQYRKTMTFNHHGDLVEAEVIRADFERTAKFKFDGYTCSMSDNDQGYSFGYDEVLGFAGPLYFDHVEEAKYDGTKCQVYYNNDAEGEPDMDADAFYVNRKGFLIGRIQHNDDPENRVVYNYTYHASATVTLNDFTFSDSYAHRCPDGRIYHAPDSYFGQCAASTTGVVLAIVLATILASLVF